jgi:hypothetical protein
MKKTPIHPPLIALFPVLSVYSANLSLAPHAELWRPALASVIGACVVWLMCAALLRNIEKGAVAASVIALAFFGYGHLQSLVPLKGFLLLALWTVATFGLAALLATRLKATNVVNALSVFLVLAAGGQAALGYARAGALRVNASAGELAQTTSAAKKPDIFYIILDGYGRADALERSIGFDNSSFISELVRRGFYIGDKSRSNYVQTELSLASSLNMDLIPALLPNVGPRANDRTFLQPFINDSAVARFLDRTGYLTIGVTTGFPSIRFDGMDVTYHERSGLRLIETALLQMTPLAEQKRTMESLFDQRRKHLLTAFETLDALAVPGPQPRFVTAHILAPHPPFVFRPDGSERPKQSLFTYADGSDYLDHVGTKEDYRAGYSDQIQYINKRLLETIDALTSHPGQKPIIILQGDHGSKVDLHQNSLEETDAVEAFAILNAFLVPPHIEEQLYPEITPVNTFRVLLGSLFGASLPLLPDRSWYSEYPTPYNFVDVTEQATP